MLEFLNDKVVIQPQAKKFFSGVKKTDLQDLITYLYYYYSSDSYLAQVLPEDRVELALELVTNKKVVESNVEFIKRYEDILLTPEQRLAQSQLKKIEEVIKVFNDTPITIDNLDDMAKNMKSINEMYTLMDKVKTILAKSTNSTKGKGAKMVNTYEELNFNDV